MTERLDCDECRATLDIPEDFGLVEVAGACVRVLDIEDYDRSTPRRLADQVIGRMRERCV